MGKRADYDWYKSHKVCVCCKKQDAVPGYVKCCDCIWKANEAYNSLDKAIKRKRILKNCEREKKIHKQGLCIKCGKPVCERSKWFCEEHRIARNKQVQEYRRKRKVYKTETEKDATKQAKLLALREGYYRYQQTERAEVNNQKYKEVGQKSLLKIFMKRG